jgi:hypothetical protein
MVAAFGSVPCHEEFGGLVSFEVGGIVFIHSMLDFRGA